MAKGKKSFLLYADIITTVEQLPDDKAGELFKLILDYVNDKEPEPTDLLLKIAFEPIKNHLKRDLAKYNELVERAQKNGKKGGRPKKLETQINQEEPKKPSGLNYNQKKPVNVIVTVNDIDNDIDKGINKKQLLVNTFIDREKKFINNLKDFSNEFDKETLNGFYYYWSETNNAKNPKMRFELEKTWNLKLRLNRWKKNNYGKPNNKTEKGKSRINKFAAQNEKSKLGSTNDNTNSHY